jgi:hypothetical protein
MTPIRGTLGLTLMIVVVLLAAGCMGQAETRKSDTNVTSPVSTTPPISTTTEIEPPQISQEGYWIKIDPISDKYTNEIFSISSTTNLSAGEEILVQVYSSTFHTGPKFPINEFYGATGTVRVIQGMNGINITLFVVNTSELKPVQHFSMFFVPPILTGKLH